MKYLLYCLLFAFLIFHSAGTTFAADPQPIGKGRYGDWNAFVFTENGEKVCYMATQPVSAKGNYSRRGDIFALVTHRPGEGTKNVFSYITGYPYKAGSKVSVDIQGQKFELFTQDDTAWAPDSETDNALADKIRQGSKMIVKGTSSRGTLTTDVISLKGSTAAHSAISKECGINN